MTTEKQPDYSWGPRWFDPRISAGNLGSMCLIAVSCVVLWCKNDARVTAVETRQATQEKRQDAFDASQSRQDETIVLLTRNVDRLTILVEALQDRHNPPQDQFRSKGGGTP